MSNSRNLLCLPVQPPLSGLYHMYNAAISLSLNLALFISTLRLRCQTSAKHLLKLPARFCFWESASWGLCCLSAALESLCEARHPLVFLFKCTYFWVLFPSAVLSTRSMLVMWSPCPVCCELGWTKKPVEQISSNSGCYAGWLRVRTQYAGSDGRNVALVLWFQTKATEAKFWKRGLSPLLLSEEKMSFLWKPTVLSAEKRVKKVFQTKCHDTELSIMWAKHALCAFRVRMLIVLCEDQIQKPEMWNVKAYVNCSEAEMHCSHVHSLLRTAHRPAHTFPHSQRKLCLQHKAELSFPVLPTEAALCSPLTLQLAAQ